MARVLPPLYPDDWSLPASLLCARSQPGRALLADRRVAAALEAELLRTSARFEVALLTYCVVPDTVWMVAIPRRADNSARAMAARWRYLTGLWYHDHAGGALWRGRVGAEVLRDWDTTWAAVRRVWREPVRSGVARQTREYRWAGGLPSFSEADCSARPSPR